MTGGGTVTPLRQPLARSMCLEPLSPGAVLWLCVWVPRLREASCEPHFFANPNEALSTAAGMLTTGLPLDMQHRRPADFAGLLDRDERDTLQAWCSGRRSELPGLRP
jgi:hypothetical protein